MECEHGRPLGIYCKDCGPVKQVKLKSVLSEDLNALVGLANEFEKEGEFLSNTDDHETDRACGKVYKECAERIRKTLEEIRGI